MDYVLSLAAEVGAVDDKSIKAAQKIVQNYFDSKKIENRKFRKYQAF